MGGSCIGCIQARGLLVHPAQGAGEDLLPLEGAFGGAGEAAAARLGLAATFARLLPGEGLFGVAQRRELAARLGDRLAIQLLDSGIVGGPHDLRLVVLQQAQLALVGQ